MVNRKKRFIFANEKIKQEIMKKGKKELLFKDLCSRLPYNCKVAIAEGGIDGLQWDNVTLNSYLLYQIEEEDGWEYVKPYLRPMSSMTRKERSTYITLLAHGPASYTVAWLDAKHFDHRVNKEGDSLIALGLAIEVTKDNNPYKD